jgi:Protein of unknown function (DUF1566)
LIRPVLQVVVGCVLCTAAVASAAAAQVCDTSRYTLSMPTARFEDNGDGTVTDKESRLMWLRCSVGQRWTGSACEGSWAPHDWQSAQAAAGVLNRSGAHFFNDWRLPTLPEMATITERQCRNPRTNPAVFPNTPTVPHWTSTPRPGGGVATSAFTLSFGDEGIVYRPFEQQHAVRLVRPSH